MYEVETIPVDDDNRLVVYYDDSSGDDPRDWGWGVSVLEMNYRYGYEVENPEGDEAVNVFNYVIDRTADDVKAERAMRLWMYLSGDTRAVEFRDVRVYRDVYNYLVFGEDSDQIDGFMDVFSRWKNGEIYLVVHQKREQWTNADETEEMDTWEWEDSIGGCYLDDEYTAEVVAREYFDIEMKKD